MGNDTTRRMPPLRAIVNYWSTESRSDTFPALASHWIGWSEPFCFRCGWLVPQPEQVPEFPRMWNLANGWLERAHLHERFQGGADTADNLVPLCNLCHRVMPELITDRDTAIDWINSPCPDRDNDLWQTATDCKWGGEEYRAFPGRAVFYNFRLHADGLIRKFLIEAA